MLREWIDRLLGTLRARRADADLQAELQSHLAFAAEAGRRDRRAGDAGHGRAARSPRPAVAARARPPTSCSAGGSSRRGRVVSGAAILSLGLAIGATSAAFRLVDAVVLRPLPVAAPERLVVRGDLVRRRPAPHGLLRQLGLPDLPALPADGRRSRRPAGGRLEQPGRGGRRGPAMSPSGSTGSTTRATSSACSGCSPPSGACSVRATIARRAAIRSRCIAHDYWQRRFGGDRRRARHVHPDRRRRCTK